MIYPNKPLYLLSLLGYIYHLTYYTLTTKDNIYEFPPCHKRPYGGEFSNYVTGISALQVGQIEAYLTPMHD